MVTSDDLNIDMSEKRVEYFRKYSLRGIERIFPRPSILLGFQLRGVVILTPPPATWDNVAETAPRAQLNLNVHLFFAKQTNEQANKQREIVTLHDEAQLTAIWKR